MSQVGPDIQLTDFVCLVLVSILETIHLPGFWRGEDLNFDFVSLLNEVKVQCGAWEGRVHWTSRPVWPALLVTFCRHSELATYNLVLQLC